jgi:hypothetical protein
LPLFAIAAGLCRELVPVLARAANGKLFHSLSAAVGQKIKLVFRFINARNLVTPGRGFTGIPDPQRRFAYSLCAARLRFGSLLSFWLLQRQASHLTHSANEPSQGRAGPASPETHSSSLVTYRPFSDFH